MRASVETGSGRVGSQVHRGHLPSHSHPNMEKSCEPDEWHRARQYVTAGTYVPVALQACCEATTSMNSTRHCAKFVRRFGQLFLFSKLSLVKIIIEFDIWNHKNMNQSSFLFCFL